MTCPVHHAGAVLDMLHPARSQRYTTLLSVHKSLDTFRNSVWPALAVQEFVSNGGPALGCRLRFCFGTRTEPPLKHSSPVGLSMVPQGRPTEPARGRFLRRYFCICCVASNTDEASRATAGTLRPKPSRGTRAIDRTNALSSICATFPTWSERPLLLAKASAPWRCNAWKRDNPFVRRLAF